jgi:hypothetical protein
MKHLVLTLLPLICLSPVTLHAAPAAAIPATAPKQRAASQPAAMHRIIKASPVMRRLPPAQPTAGAIGGPFVARRHDHSARPIAIGGAPRHSSAATAAVNGTGHGH